MAPLDPQGQSLFSLLQQYPQNPGGVIQQIRVQADSGDRRATAIGGYLMTQQGQFPDAAQYVRTAAGDGAMFLAGFFVQTASGQPDPSVRALLSEFIGLAARTYTGFDPYQAAQNAVAQGDPQAMQDILDAAYEMPPSTSEMESLVASGRQQLAELQSSVARVTAERDQTLSAFPALLSEARSELDGLREVAQEAGALATDTSAEVQAREYGERAASSEKTAGRYTFASIALAILIAIASVVIAIVSFGDGDALTDGLKKAAFALPFLFLNGYLVSLAREARHEALRWRHVQLQLKAATPFLGVLDDDRRKDVVALLALRFFPGQPLPISGRHDASDGESGDADALAVLLAEGRKLLSNTAAPSESAGSPTAP